MIKMIDKIMILDGSNRLHVNNTLQSLEQIREIRGIPQKIWESHDVSFVRSYANLAWNPQRQQVDVEYFMARLGTNDFLHRENSDALKIILLDQDIYSSARNSNFGFGVTFPYSNSNRYILISTARLGDEMHARNVISHEIGHAFGAPNPSRPGVYECLGSHCPDRNCTMHQEVNFRDSYDQSLRVARLGKVYCNACEKDIRRFRNY